MKNILVSLMLAALWHNSYAFDNPFHNQSEKIRVDTNIFNDDRNSFDTTANYFGEKYRLSIKIKSLASYHMNTKNALFTIVNIKNKMRIINDSIGCMNPDIEFEDYNLDGISDIKVFNLEGARANTTYNLYIADPKTKQFHKVKGFNKLPNAKIDSNKIITSCALYGKLGYSFYKITPNYTLVKLGKTIEADPTEESQKNVDKEYQRILKSLGKK